MSVVELSLAADAAAWQALGSSIDTDASTTIGGVRVRLVSRTPRSRFLAAVSW